VTLLPDIGTLLLPFRPSQADNTKRIRVGVVTEETQSPEWIEWLVAFLKEIPGLEVKASRLEGPAEERAKPGWLTDRLYSLSRAKFDPFKPSECGAAETVRDASDLRALNCDVILWLAWNRNRALDLHGAARHGLFTVALGEGRGLIPFWSEVSASSAITRVNIFWHDCSLTQGRAVRRLETPTIPGLFVTLNAEQPLIGTIRTLAELCIEIRGDALRFEERISRVPQERLLDGEPGGYPSNLEAARLGASKLLRSAVLRWTARKGRQWFVAMRPNTGKSIEDPARVDLAGFEEIPMPAGVDQMADPFLFESEGRSQLFFEALRKNDARGRLATIEIAGDGSRSEMEVVLERPYHLSYPCVFASDGDVFLMPETSGAKRVDIYRFVRFPSSVELVCSPVEGTNLVDTTPVRIDDRWYFFTTTPEPFMETFLFSSCRLDGPWELHPANPVSTSVGSCRSAGHLFWKNGRLFRPTQDCSVRYGYAIVVNEVTRLTKDEFEERAVARIRPIWKPGLLGTHTWNESPTLQVIDGIRDKR